MARISCRFPRRESVACEDLMNLSEFQQFLSDTELRYRDLDYYEDVGVITQTISSTGAFMTGAVRRNTTKTTFRTKMGRPNRFVFEASRRQVGLFPAMRVLAWSYGAAVQAWSSQDSKARHWDSIGEALAQIASQTDGSVRDVPDLLFGSDSYHGLFRPFHQGEVIIGHTRIAGRLCVHAESIRVDSRVAVWITDDYCILKTAEMRGLDERAAYVEPSWGTQQLIEQMKADQSYAHPAMQSLLEEFALHAARPRYIQRTRTTRFKPILNKYIDDAEFRVHEA